MKGSSSRDNVESSFEDFEQLFSSLSEGLSSSVTEEDVRLKVLNRILTEVLGWNFDSITTEEHTSTGKGFLDYKLSIGGRARLVVEAKRDGLSFGLENRTPARNYKLNGPVLSAKPLPWDGITQAVNYCGDKNAELACVTNGREWIIFRGSRAGDGTDTLDGQAFIFTDLYSIRDHFAFFYDLLARERVEKYYFRSMFQEAEGRPVRVHTFSRTLAPPGSKTLLPSDKIYSDLSQVMDAFFKRLSGDEDEEMLAHCFVTTRESQIADENLARISEDLVTRVKHLDSDGSADLVQTISNARSAGKNEFVLLIGTKGAGKSTFIDRFFRSILPKELRSDCILVRCDLGRSFGKSENITDWLTNKLISSLEGLLFEEEGFPEYDDLQGMFFDEYTRWRKGPHAYLYNTDKNAFKIRFGEHIEDLRQHRPEDYIRRLLHHIVTVRKKVPCLIFDNTDHHSIDFQEIVFQYARGIYENQLCLVVTPITDKTSWQLSHQGALRSFESQSFHLPTPLPKQVLEKRIAFLGEKLAQEEGQRATGYFIGKGIQLNLDDLHGFAQALQKALIETGKTSQWLGNLANQDIRRCLDLTREVVCSPYIPLAEMVKAVVAGNSFQFDEGNLIRAVIRKGYDRYPTEHPFIQNVFSLSSEIESTPLLGLRILRLLRDAKHHEASGLEAYMEIDQILDYAQAIGVERSDTLLALDTLLKTGLCLNYDPTVRDVNDALRVRISPSGDQHLAWGVWDENYIGSMIPSTPIHNEVAFNEMEQAYRLKGREKWKRTQYLFIKYMLDNDQMFVTPSDHPAFEGQTKVTKSLRRRMNKLGKQLFPRKK